MNSHYQHNKDTDLKLSQILRFLYNRKVRFDCADQHHPLVQWIDHEWSQLGANKEKPALLIVHAAELFAGAYQSLQGRDPPVLFIESWYQKRLDINMLRATLSHEIDHLLRRPVPKLRLGEYLADATAAIRAGKENTIKCLKALEDIERQFGEQILYPPPLSSRIEELERETYFQQAARFYEAKLPASHMRNISNPQP
jgi:hypothetical protein